MPAIGDKVFLHCWGSFYPYAWCGRVVSIEGPRDYTLDHASLLPHTREEGVTWCKVADGDPAARAAVCVRVRRPDKPIEVKGVMRCEEWVGDLPTADQH